MRRDVDLEELVMYAEVDDGDDRLAIGRPRGVVYGVLEVRQHRLRRSAGRRHDEDRRVVVRLEALVRIGEEQDLTVIGRDFSGRFRNLVSSQGASVGAGGVHHPHLATKAIAGQRRRRAVHGYLCAVPREPIFQYRHVAGRHRHFGAARDDHFPELLVLVVLFECVDVVSQAFAFALVSGRRVAG